MICFSIIKKCGLKSTFADLIARHLFVGLFPVRCVFLFFFRKLPGITQNTFGCTCDCVSSKPEGCVHRPITITNTHKLLIYRPIRCRPPRHPLPDTKHNNNRQLLGLGLKRFNSRFQVANVEGEKCVIAALCTLFYTLWHHIDIFFFV